MSDPEHGLQVVFVKWGNRYDATYVLRAVQAIRRHATVPVHFVCITDSLLAPPIAGVREEPFPQFAGPWDELRIGCRLKLAVFAPGLLEDGVPAVYFDLDTLIRGDVACIGELLRRRPALYLLRSHFVPLWRIRGWLRRLRIDKYYHGNSSAIAFWPQDYHWLFAAFNEGLAVPAVPVRSKAYLTDDRFISSRARDTVRVLPTSLIVKFSAEYMSPWHWIQNLRGRLPWVRRRRQSQIAVTFAGAELKPDRLSALPLGTEVRYKRRRTMWRHTEFRDYWLETIPAPHTPVLGCMDCRSSASGAE